MSPNPTLTVERLREIISYDPDTGLLTWVMPTGRRAKAGSEAGTVATGGYRQVIIEGRRYKSHRLAWFHTYGVWPNGFIDHINRRPGDNRIANLRDVTHRQNQQNAIDGHRDSSSGLRGVVKDPRNGRWRSTIMVDGKLHWLGTFDTAEKASEAYQAAKRDLHPYWAA